ncbi:hypothetical protein GQR58_020680 [Nymphon striatum]|nr:hypothetical protein GQR58_020680 [Nymphon striatum]
MMTSLNLKIFLAIFKTKINRSNIPENLKSLDLAVILQNPGELQVFNCVCCVVRFYADTLSVSLKKIVVPSPVFVGDNIEISCITGMPVDDIYSLKWFKDDEEFYRFLPKEFPKTMSYYYSRMGDSKWTPLMSSACEMFELRTSLPDETIDNSYEGNVYLTDIDLNSAGQFTCEVSGETPVFRTKTLTKILQVYILPNDQPRITGEKERYKINDAAELNCSSDFSYPPAKLTWYINKIMLSVTLIEFYHINPGTLLLRDSITVARLYPVEKIGECTTQYGKKDPGVSWRDRKTNSLVRTQTGCKDLTQTVKGSKWNWAGHLPRRTDDRRTTKSTIWITDRGGRKRGKPKRRWVDDIAKFDRDWTPNEYVREYKETTNGKGMVKTRSRLNFVIKESNFDHDGMMRVTCNAVIGEHYSHTTSQNIAHDVFEIQDSQLKLHSIEGKTPFQLHITSVLVPSHKICLFIFILIFLS